MSYHDLFNCAANGNIEGCKDLISSGIHINSVGEGGTALHFAIKNNQIDCFHFLIEQGANVDINVHEVGTPLHIAASNNQVTCMELLLKAGADPNDVILNDGWEFDETPLHIAARNGYELCVKLLLDYNANMNIENCDGFLAIELAIRSNQTNIIDILHATQFKNIKPSFKSIK